MTSPFTRTSEGFLAGRAIVTSCGVFTYRRLDGTLQSELRLPDEVFKEDSLKSMVNKPLTNGHPNGLVTPETAHELQVGSLGGNPSSWVDTYAVRNPQDAGRGSSGSDGIHVANDLMITDGETILEVENGKRSLSMGYTCDIEETAGIWAGVEYNAIQRNIRYNHCAIVPTARAGDAAMIHLDSADAVLVDKLKSEPDVRLFYAEDESDDTVVQPDIIVVCDRDKLGKEGCRGAPDFAVEILSPSNTAVEMQRKFKLYRQAGVREYWVLDPESQSLHTHLFEEGRILSRFYGDKEIAPVEILPGLEIDLEPVFAE
jgi:hypothetical protein